MKNANKNELKNVVALWTKAYETRDKDLVKKIFIDSKESFHYGTGLDEQIYGLEGMLEQLDRDWKQSESIRIKPTGFRYQYLAEDIAWVACEFIPRVKIGSDEVELPELRSTLVLKKIESNWLIAHTHASWPCSEQKEGDSFPNIFN